MLHGSTAPMKYKKNVSCHDARNQVAEGFASAYYYAKELSISFLININSKFQQQQ